MGRKERLRDYFKGKAVILKLCAEIASDHLQNKSAGFIFNLMLTFSFTVEVKPVAKFHSTGVRRIQENWVYVSKSARSGGFPAAPWSPALASSLAGVGTR